MITALLYIIGFILVTSFAGYNIILACDRKGTLGALETMGLSYLFGIGAISAEIFIFGILHITFTVSYIVLPWIIFAVVNIPNFKNKFVKTGDRIGSFSAFSPFETTMAVLLVFIIGYSFFMAMVRPVESYDAVAIWSLKAKILYFAHALPRDFFTTIATKFNGAHPDYPLLLPLSEVWFYAFTNNFNDLFVKVLFPLNFAAFLAVFYVFLKRSISNRSLALVFTFLLASIRQFSNYATNGYADLPMAIYGSLTFLGLYLFNKENKPIYLWTSFLSCIFALWTKNEGAVVFIGFITILSIYIFTQGKKEKSASLYATEIFMTVVLIALFILWALFKNFMKLENDVVNLHTFINYSPLDIFKRLTAILYEYQKQAFGVKYWNLSWILFILLGAAGFRKLFSGEIKYITLPVFIILLCYTAVYFITPQDILWQLRTTTSRLLIHILPLVIFYIGMRVKEIYPNG